MVAFVASLSPALPFHVMGYIPVPGAPWRRPTEQEMERVVALVRQYLHEVGSSHLTSEQAKDLTARDERFHVEQVL
jgi:pyruvate formate lyase activating enzyme